MFFPTNFQVGNPMQTGGMNLAPQLGMNLMNQGLGLQQQGLQTQYMGPMLRQALLHNQIQNNYLPGQLGANIFATGMQSLSPFMSSPYGMAALLDPDVNQAVGSAFGNFDQYVGGSGQPISFSAYNQALQNLKNSLHGLFSSGGNNSTQIPTSSPSSITQPQNSSNNGQLPIGTKIRTRLKATGVPGTKVVTGYQNGQPTYNFFPHTE